MPPMPASRSGLPRLCFLSYRQIREFAMPVVAEYADRAHIEIVDGKFGEALTIAQERIRHNEVDVFVSAGSNASILRTGLQAPVASIQLTGFDLFQALIRARNIAPRVGVVMYGHTIPELESVKELLNIDIRQHAYRTPQDARLGFEALRQDGFEVIIGSSLVVELAQEAGLHGLLAYSLDSVRKGFDDALELARVAQLETSRYEQLHSVLYNLQEAVVAVDRSERIITANPAMQQVLAGPGIRLEGQILTDIAPALSLRACLDSGQQDRAVALQFAQRDWIAHRTPIREQGQIVGAALTLYDARAIQTADTNLRAMQRRHQHMARHTFDSLAGSSAPMLQALSSARRFAPTDLTVLITGESGTGKEVFAQAMHNASPRAGKPFVAVNCASFPEALLESELFGYEEGAFTGARRGGKAGLLEAAHTGTLFLDEIGDMPMPLQTRLLRVLQERELMRLGATTIVPIDIRVIAATHQPLTEHIAKGRFRQDLYYRLNTLRLALPALRDRKEDIAALITPMVARCLSRLGSRLPAAPALQALMPRLLRYAWPGNVRELENHAERIAVFLAPFTDGKAIAYEQLSHDCPELFAADSDPLLQGKLPGASQTRRIEQALEAAGGHAGKAAQLLGISRSTLWRWMRAAPDIGAQADADSHPPATGSLTRSHGASLQNTIKT